MRKEDAIFSKWYNSHENKLITLGYENIKECVRFAYLAGCRAQREANARAVTAIDEAQDSPYGSLILRSDALNAIGEKRDEQ